MLHRGYTLATEGHTASSKGESTLDRCAEPQDSGPAEVQEPAPAAGTT
jgi:hypothetical protein